MIGTRVRIAGGTPRSKYGIITGETKDKRRWIILREDRIHPVKLHKALVERIDNAADIRGTTGEAGSAS